MNGPYMVPHGSERLFMALYVGAEKGSLTAEKSYVKFLESGNGTRGHSLKLVKVRFMRDSRRHFF